MAERDMYEGRARSAAAAAEEGLQRLSSLSIASTAKYTTSVSRAFNEMKKDIERLAFAATDTGGSNRVAKLRDGQALYMDERSRHAAQERAFEEAGQTRNSGVARQARTRCLQGSRTQGLRSP